MPAAANRLFAAATALRRRADLGCRGRVAGSSCPRLLRQPAEGTHGGSRSTALGELRAAGLAAVDVDDQDVTAARWSAVPATRDPLLDAVDLHGAHDFRHTYATWLEDAGIPARVIDELMGHEATGRSRQRQGSAMGAHYRHTIPEMAARVVDAIQQRLTVVLDVAEKSLESNPNRSTLRVF
jgi:Phage integrase family